MCYFPTVTETQISKQIVDFWEMAIFASSIKITVAISWHNGGCERFPAPFLYTCWPYVDNSVCWHVCYQSPGTEARAASEFRAQRHAMERASPEFLPSNAVRLRPKIDAFCGIKNTKSISAGASPWTSLGELTPLSRPSKWLGREPVAPLQEPTPHLGPLGHTAPFLLTQYCWQWYLVLLFFS